jgi:hypothetical protein
MPTVPVPVVELPVRLLEFKIRVGGAVGAVKSWAENQMVTVYVGAVANVVIWPPEDSSAKVGAPR